MTDTVDKLLGLADRFASRHADACEARAAGLHGQWDDDARQAKAELEAALREALGGTEPPGKDERND